MRSAIILLSLLLACLSGAAQAEKQPKLTYCAEPATFANCTQAPCKPIGPNQTETTCQCNVQPGPSHPAGEKSVSYGSCKPVKGDYVQSRYAPAVAYQVCPNTKVWANCLGAPCVFDPSDKTKALCTCPVVTSNDFVIVLPDTQCSTARCQDDTIYSSATAKGAKHMTAFLKRHHFPDFQPPQICAAPAP